ncbi:hypothetical protein BMF89_14970 [Arthrobacter sp. SRS-W-1-2016]|nr:hypothetical protein BMF89_14970 [Arthrobacter sp. SRS-W-1-2016]
MGMDTGQGGGRRESGALESQVLGVLWASDQAMTGADVHTALSAPELSYKTILTVLTRLQAKGRLTREKSGRAFTYRPVPDGSATAAERMAKVLARGADRSAVLQGFLEAIDPADEDLLRSLLSAPRDPGDRT